MCDPIDQQIYARLSDKELLRKLIGARLTKQHYRGSLTSVFTRNSDAPERCLIARELIQRWLTEEIRRDDVLSAPAAVKDYLRLHFADREYESFVGLFLDSQHRVITVTELFRGTLTQTTVYPREVVKTALQVNAAAVIFSHNHPSGVAEPSRSDELLTQALKQALALVEVRVLDHFLISGPIAFSFAERGLL